MPIIPNLNLLGNLGQLAGVGNNALQPYLTNGLTYISKNPDIIDRDQAGNFVIDPDTSQLLIIETIEPRYFKRSVIRAVNTQFEYFSFPATIEGIETTIELDDSDIDFELDTISTRYTIAYQEVPEGVPNDYYRLNTSYASSWFTNGGENLAGYIRLPFIGGTQLEPGTFTITPDILDILIDRNKTIKFSIQMIGTPFNPSLNTGFSLRLRRDNPTVYRPWVLPTLNTQTQGLYNAGDYPLLTMEYIVDINDTAEYDKFYVEAVAGNPSFYLGNSTVWDIELIDNDPSLFTNAEAGVTAISANTDLVINGITVISGQ